MTETQTHFAFCIKGSPGVKHAASDKSDCRKAVRILVPRLFRSRSRDKNFFLRRFILQSLVRQDGFKVRQQFSCPRLR